jgi:hypothetical protein
MASDEPAVQVLKTTGLPVGDLRVARLSSIPRPATSLLYRSSKPLDLRVARLSSIPRSAMSLLYDTTAIDESAVQVLKTTGLENSEAVIDTTASDEPAVQVLKTTGLPVGDLGVARLSSIPRPATSLLYRSSKPLDFRLVT